MQVERTATPEQIKDAYRALVKKYHPDVAEQQDTGDMDNQKFREITEAYQVLSVRESRASFDKQMRKNPSIFIDPNAPELTQEQMIQ